MKRLILFLLLAPALHAQTLISQANVVWYQSSASLTVPAGQNLACVAFGNIQGGAGDATLSDSLGDHWTLATQVTGATLQAAWFAQPCSPGVHVVNVSRATTAPSYRSANVLAYSGVGPFDNATVGAGQSAQAMASLNTAVAGELLVASFTENGPLNPTEVLDSSFTLRLSTYWQQLVSADKVAGAAGPYSGSLTFQPPFTVTPSWTAILLAFKPPAPSVPPQLQNFTIYGGLRYCTLCDKSAGDDTVTGINLLAGLKVVLTQVDASQKPIGAVTFIMDANGNISGPDNITINATNPLLFTVAVFTPAGTALGSLAENITIDPVHFQGEGSFHVLIRMDQATPSKIRGVDWWTGA